MQPWLTQIAQVNPPLFVEFLLDALHVALNEAVTSNVEHPDPVQKLLYVFQEKTEQGITSLMDALDLSHRPTFRRNYLNPALAQGYVERTIPDKPTVRHKNIG